MYKSNLNFDRFNKHFNHLVTKGFIEEMNGPNGRKVYKTTELGKTLLEVLKKAQQLISSETKEKGTMAASAESVHTAAI